MGIHRLDNDPVMAARWHCRQHLSPVAIYVARMLSQIHWMHGYEGPENSDEGPFFNPQGARYDRRSPSFDWLMQSIANYRWAALFSVSLAKEFGKQRGRQLKPLGRLEWLLRHEPELPDGGETAFQPATLPAYEHIFEVTGDPVATCRRFYTVKIECLVSGPATWPPDLVPPWLEDARASIDPKDRILARALLNEYKEEVYERRRNNKRNSAA